MATIWHMHEVRKTEQFVHWIDNLSDTKARARIQVRIERLIAGNPGDVKSVGKGISELRIDYGPGYRVYYIIRDREIILLLSGGDKNSQSADIKKAIKLINNL